MKKFLKNAVLIMLVSCFILNIVNLVWQYVEHYKVVQEVINVAQQINNGDIVVEDTYQMFATAYHAGFGNKVAIQAGIIVLSFVLGITIGMIVTFEEKSKIRVVIIYILGMLLIALIPTLCYVIYYMDYNAFFEELLYHLEDKWKWYTLGFFMTYAIKIYINNKKTKELNQILSEKQKQNNLEK